MTDEAKSEVEKCDQQIKWILCNDGISAWLKAALRGAADCDPVSITNDVEILYQLLKRLSAAQIRHALDWSTEC